MSRILNNGHFRYFSWKKWGQKSVWFWFDFYINWYFNLIDQLSKNFDGTNFEKIRSGHILTFCQFWWFHIKIILSVKHILSRPFPNENFSKIRNFWHVISYKKCHVIDNYRTSGFNGKTSGLLAYYYVRIFMSYTFSVTIHLGIACFG